MGLERMFVILIKFEIFAYYDQSNYICNKKDLFGMSLANT